MAEHFFVTGLPRSRTAWIANLLTTGRSFCHHDAFEKCYPRVSDLVDVLAHTPAEFVGASGSDIAFFPDIISTFPRARHALIKRDPADVKSSIEKLFGADMSVFMDMAAIRLAEYEARFKPLVLRVEELDSHDGVIQLWRHCLPHEPFNEERLRMLRNFNVQVTASKIEAFKKKIREV